jgi:ABC-type antimicrobial peptide transport system permease subunit
MAILAGSFGFLATLLAVIGMYGLISYLVVQRTSEIGIRMALGGDRGCILRLMMGEAITLVAVGVAIGACLALAAANTASSMLFGLKARDPLTFVFAIALFAAVALAATYFPARRASRLDPTVALRYE